MKFRAAVIAGSLALTLLTAACAKSVSGQAEPAGGAVPSAAASSAAAGATGLLTDTSALPVPSPEAPSSPDQDATSAVTTAEAPSTSEPSTSTASDSSTTSRVTSKTSSITSIPGLPADCNKVLAGLQAFTTLFQDISSTSDVNATISQAKVDAALKSMPASGLPAPVQANMNILRASVSSAGGKTITDLALSLSDGKVTTALGDMSTWISTNCY